jgi:uncharacterized protein YecE (DUF72 family)
MTLHIGTSGWAYKQWKPDFYPKDLPQKRFLEFYGGALSACEVNATFYRMQSSETFCSWRDAVPESFRFTSKAHRAITHARRFAPDDTKRGFIDAYVEGVRIFGDRLGAVLLQLPPSRPRDDEGLSALVDALPDDLPFAIELQHESWDVPEVVAAAEAAGGTVCVTDKEGRVPESLPPGPLAYVKLRAEQYSPEARAGWLELLRKESVARPVYAFAKHEGIPTKDLFGGVGLAQWLVAQTSVD